MLKEHPDVTTTLGCPIALRKAFKFAARGHERLAALPQHDDAGMAHYQQVPTDVFRLRQMNEIGKSSVSTSTPNSRQGERARKTTLTAHLAPATEFPSQHQGLQV
jgi:hypothetical protein